MTKMNAPTHHVTYELDGVLRITVDYTNKSFSAEGDAFGSEYTSGFVRVYDSHFVYITESDDANNTIDIEDGETPVSVPALLIKTSDNTYVYAGDGNVVKFNMTEPILGFTCIPPHSFSMPDDELSDDEFCEPFSFALTQRSVLMFGYSNGTRIWSALRATVEDKLAHFTQDIPVYYVDLDGLPRWDHLQDMFNHEDPMWTSLCVTTLVYDTHLDHPHLDLSVKDCVCFDGWDGEVLSTPHRIIIVESASGSDPTLVAVATASVHARDSSSCQRKCKHETLYGYLRKRGYDVNKNSLKGQYVVSERALDYSRPALHWPQQLMLHLLRRTLLGTAARCWANRRAARHGAARIIQSAWRTAVCDPSHVVCRTRLLREFEEDDMHIS
jgi:hypothetical protein